MNFEKLLSQHGEKYKSQKNEVSTVYSDDTKAVRKSYKTSQAMAIELATIRLLQKHNVLVPGILFTQDNTAIFEQIDGITYLEMLERIDQNLLNENSITRAVKELCLWLEDYYVATNNALRGDVNFRNFIFTPYGKCVSVDFEEPLEFAKRERDMGRILAYCATYDPPFTLGKLNMCKSFLKNFELMNADLEEIHNEYNKEIDEMKTRRAGFSQYEQQVRDFWGLIIKE